MVKDAYVKDPSFCPDQRVCAELINCAQTEDQLDEAMQFLTEKVYSGDYLLADIKPINNYLAKCIQLRLMKNADDFLQQMQKPDSTLKPNVKTFLLVIRAFSYLETADFERAEKYFRQMRQLPDVPISDVVAAYIYLVRQFLYPERVKEARRILVRACY